MVIRKYYNTDNAGGGGEAETVETPSIAALMAKHGVQSNSGELVATPININEVKEPVKTETQSTPAATATAEPEKKETTEAPKPTEVVETQKTEVQPIVEQKKSEAPTLSEVLKQSQPDTIFKELGYDQETAGFIKELKGADPKLVALMQSYKNGTLWDYVKELSTDYSKMEPEDVMRHQLRLDYPKATPKQLEILYKKEVIDAYNLDSDDETEVEEGKLLLAAKADKYRDSFIANQEKYLLPSKPEPKQETAENTADQKAKENVEQYIKEITSSPFTKSVFSDKKISIGEGDDKFTFPVSEPQSLIDTLIDPNKWVEYMYKVDKGADGKEVLTLDAEKQILVALVQKEGMGLFNKLAQHYKSLGGSKLVATIENAKPTDEAMTSKSDVMPTNPAEAMAKAGRLNPGGYS